MNKYALILGLSLLAGCSSINFSQTNPEAKDFHPKMIAVLPAVVGEHESARDEVDATVSNSLAKTGWFTNVTDASSIKMQITQSSELSDDLSKYLQRLSAFGVSDPDLAGKLGGELKSDALFIATVKSWGYGTEDGDKVARVGLSVKSINASNGTIVWKGEHELVKTYTFFKPSLHDMTGDLLAMLIKEMPH